MLTNVGPINESRLYTRVNARLPLSIYYNNMPIASQFTRNICVGGVFIDARDLGLSVNSLIKIRFVIEETHNLYDNSIPAVVKRIEANGIAVAFELIDKGIEELVQTYCQTSSDWE